MSSLSLTHRFCAMTIISRWYVANGANQFGRRDVELGANQNGLRQILKGISVGDRVVSDGSLFLQFANSLQH